MYFVCMCMLWLQSHNYQRGRTDLNDMSDTVSLRCDYLKRLQDVATSVTTHADALQQYVELLQAVERQMVRDATVIARLDEECHAATQSAERVAVMSKALASARQQTRTLARANTSNPGVSHHSSLEDILKFSKVAEAFDGESMATDGVLRAVESAEAQLARTQQALQVARQQSIRDKLAALEALKSSSRSALIDGCDEILLRQNFNFISSAAESFFFGDDERSASTFLFGGDKQSNSAVLTDTLKCAAERLSSRYADAFDALQSSAEDHQGPDGHEKFCFAVEFANRLAAEVPIARDAGSCDDYRGLAFADYVSQLSSAPSATSLHPLCEDVVVTKVVDVEPQTAAVNADPFIFLPKQWPTAKLMRIVDESEDEDGDPIFAKPPLLPPVKHILTSRFSAADPHELRELERLRVQVQQVAIQAAMLSVPQLELIQTPRITRMVTQLKCRRKRRSSESANVEPELDSSDGHYSKLEWPVFCRLSPVDGE